jgi:hypothetical protein
VLVGPAWPGAVGVVAVQRPHEGRVVPAEHGRRSYVVTFSQEVTVHVHEELHRAVQPDPELQGETMLLHHRPNVSNAV